MCTVLQVLFDVVPRNSVDVGVGIAAGVGGGDGCGSGVRCW